MSTRLFENSARTLHGVAKGETWWAKEKMHCPHFPELGKVFSNETGWCAQDFVDEYHQLLFTNFAPQKL